MQTFAEVQKLHAECLADSYAPQTKLKNDTQLHALGAFKAIRNFVHPLLQSRYVPQVGLDRRPEAVGALGDMLMYICSLRRSLNLGLVQQLPTPMQVHTAEDASVEIIMAFANIADAWREGYASYLCEQALAAVLGACEVCAIPWQEAAQASLDKLAWKVKRG